uniref:ATP synthase F0 subunit 8 n=1 Tax=Undinula vulgaris TaxID=184747 RepID=A0A6B9D688_UNDVU|nr:ATP synthase F0 subunit 8 [Undinula vulgaris]
MPQMSPMNWFFLFMYFNTMLYFFMVKLFFISDINVSNKDNKMLSLNNFYFNL